MESDVKIWLSGIGSGKYMPGIAGKWARCNSRQPFCAVNAQRQYAGNWIESESIQAVRSGRRGCFPVFQKIFRRSFFQPPFTAWLEPVFTIESAGCCIFFQRPEAERFCIFCRGHGFRKRKQFGADSLFMEKGVHVELLNP